MTITARPLFVLIIFLCFSTIIKAQSQFTPYDNLPGVIKSYKPAYEESFPAWAKMLYAPSINFNEINKGFESYMALHPGEKSAVIRYYKIWRRAVAGYVQANGEILLPGMDQYYENLSEQQREAGKRGGRDVSESDWTFLGPKETFWLNEQGSPADPNSCPWQVNVYSFDVAASDPDIIYCGTETGFVNKTTDKGLTWQPLAMDYFFGGAVTAVAVHPANPDVCYVAAGNQVHKTLDGGISWTPLLQARSLFYADRLRIDATSPEKIFAASGSGVFVSNNGGASWVQGWPAPAYDIEIKPNNSNTVIALTRAGGNFSMIMSTDGGQNFAVMPGFPSNYAESSGGLLAVTADNPNLILAILLSSNNTPYLLKGTYSAGNWNWILKATGQTPAFPMDNCQGYFDLVLDISPLDENIILVGTCTLYKSVNGGTSFSAVGGYAGNFAIHPDIQDIRMQSNGETWVSTDGGMNLTIDNFTSSLNYHVRVNGLLGSDFWGFDQGWNEDIVAGGRYHNGNTAMADFYHPKALRMGGAESPTGWVLQGKSRHVAFNDLGNGWILPAMAEGKPEGRFIFSKYPNMEEYGGRRGNLVFHPNYYGTIYLGEGTGFWKSTDMGVTYNLLYNFPNQVRYLQISYNNPEVLYADIVNFGLFKTIDGGQTWVLKPALTNPPNGTAYWKGKLFFAISPFNENTIYACLQNGTWSADIGKVFRSDDGGDSWEDWTGSLVEYTKCLAVQPAADGSDLVYLFTNASNGQSAKVFYRKPGMDDWAGFGNNYPAGMRVNMALPFFRDGKLRVGGNASVWESPMQEPEFTPVINPWLEKSFYNCITDTLYFDDHSILNHQGASWHWQISPTPVYVSDPWARNPKVVLGNPGTYDVSLTVTKNGEEYIKTITGMVTTTTCPSIEDCSNPAELPKNEWELIYVDSEETNYPGLAFMSFDGDPETIWHTRWSTGDDPYPHELQVDLGRMYRIYSFSYLNRQDGENGRIREYELYLSEDAQDWGDPVSTGEFVNTSAPQAINFPDGITGQYFRLLALSEVNGNPWASAAEFSMVGCTDIFYENQEYFAEKELVAFPVPSSGLVSIALPPGTDLKYSIGSADGRIMRTGQANPRIGYFTENLANLAQGLYFIQFTDQQGTRYIARVIKQ